ncbi:ribosomal protein L25/L23 [Purpureocillium lavendulum]|uniref:Large ribosomal subunit protein uL23m n=1 Tax=Purpureocillium lavendulum TaxID=1247861 RepID=A0AB34G8Q2_9HYPO|nr:ribosomal protein L25/L23 [Purpureocillium lavendulum]
MAPRATMAEAVKAAARQLPAFRLGQKQVFLPNHVITFLRKEHLPPNEACFQVPLRFTKFDLRDYLWNLYGVEVRTVRSYVKPQPLTQRNSHSRSWYRPQPLKIMTVELAQPFQWPDLPTNLEPWSNELWKMREDLMEKRNEEQLHQHAFRIPLKSQEAPSKERKDLAALAGQMLRGEVKWSNDAVLDPKWDAVLAKSNEVAPAPRETRPNKDETTQPLPARGVLKLQDLIPPAPPPGRQVPRKDLEPDVSPPQDVLEQPAQAGFPGVHVRARDEHLGREAGRGPGAAPLRDEKPFPRLAPLRVDVVQGLARRGDLEPGPLGGELEPPGGEETRRGRREQLRGAGLVGDPHGDERVVVLREVRGHGDGVEEGTHLRHGCRRGVPVSMLGATAAAAAGGAVRPRGVEDDELELRRRVEQRLPRVLDGAAYVPGPRRHEHPGRRRGLCGPRGSRVPGTSSLVLILGRSQTGEVKRPVVTLSDQLQGTFRRGGGHEVGELRGGRLVGRSRRDLLLGSGVGSGAGGGGAE